MRSATTTALANSKHFDRYYRNKSGESIEDIAKKDGVREKAVKDSLLTVEAYRTRNTVESTNQAMSSVVLNLASRIEGAIAEALEATYESEKDGKKIEEPDHTTRLKAVSEVREIAKVIQPKSGGPQIGINVGVGISDRKASGTYVGMEERMRDIRKTIKERPQLAEAKVVQTQVLEAVAGEYVDNEEDEEE